MVSSEKFNRKSYPHYSKRFNANTSLNLVRRSWIDARRALDGTPLIRKQSTVSHLKGHFQCMDGRATLGQITGLLPAFPFDSCKTHGGDAQVIIITARWFKTQYRFH